MQETRQREVPVDGAEADGEDGSGAGDLNHAFVQIHRLEQDEDRGAAERGGGVDFAVQDQRDLAAEQIAQDSAGDAGHHAHDQHNGLRNAGLVGALQAEHRGDGKTKSVSNQKHRTGAFQRGREKKRCGTCGAAEQHIVWIGDPEDGADVEREVADGASAERGDEADDDHTEKIHAFAAGLERAGDGEYDDAEEIEDVKHGRGLYRYGKICRECESGVQRTALQNSNEQHGAARMRNVSAWRIALILIGLRAVGAAEFTLSEGKTDANGVTHYALSSPYQKNPTTLRVLATDEALKAETKRIVFVLPVEPKEEHRFGDGLEEFLKLELHKKYGVIVVAPAFEQLPWYADHATNENLRQESHFIKAIVPAADQLFPGKKTQRLLLGFSKSGWGAFCMILRHPDLFAAASAWDAPLMKAKPDQFGMGAIFGTQENFEKYEVSRLLHEKGAPFQVAKRLALSGYENFREHTQQAHALLESLKIQHDYADGPLRKHVWGSGWVEESLKALLEMVKE